MTSISIIGTGNMGGAIATLAQKAGAEVQILARDAEKAQTLAATVGATAATLGDDLTGELVVLALPYPAVAGVLASYAGRLDGRTLVDISNPLDFATFDSLVVPADASAAAEIAESAGVPVLKAFNTNFAATLATGAVGASPTTVLVAGDAAEPKAALVELVRAAGLAAEDAGALSRARELEAIGFLQLTLAVSGKIGWASGFALVK